MNDSYLNTVTLMLRIAQVVFASGRFALKGGTAINLFIRDMPRLSVDLDLVFIDHTLDRDAAISQITESLDEITGRLEDQGLKVKNNSGADVECKVFVTDQNGTMVKVEINHVMRGTILPTVTASLRRNVQDKFRMYLELPMLSHDEIYGSKLVAALDRQHPRDLFDVLQLIENEGITEGIMDAFVAYIACHNRPVHEVLEGVFHDIQYEYENNFVGMTLEDVPLDALVQTRTAMIQEIRSQLNQRHKDFLMSLVRAEPDWSLMDCPHLQDLPGIKWKLRNLNKLKDENASKFAEQETELTNLFGRIGPDLGRSM